MNKNARRYRRLRRDAKLDDSPGKARFPESVPGRD